MGRSPAALPARRKNSPPPPGRIGSGEITPSAAQLRSRTSKVILCRREDTGRQELVGSLRLSRVMLRARRPQKGLQDPGWHEQPPTAHVWMWQKDVLGHKRTPERGVCPSSTRLSSPAQEQTPRRTPLPLPPHPGPWFSRELRGFLCGIWGWAGRRGSAPGLPSCCSWVSLMFYAVRVWF